MERSGFGRITLHTSTSPYTPNNNTKHCKITCSHQPITLLTRHRTTVPLQNILDVIHTLYKSPTPNDKRTHFISLLLLLGTKRFSDITRTFRHPRCISVFIRRLDTPTWARAHRFISLQDVHDLGCLTHVACLTHRDYIILKIRPYMAKTAMGQGRLYGGYATFTENRFAEAFCAVKAFFEYIKHTKNFKINTNLKCDKNTIMSSIPNNQGVDFVPAAPLLTSLNGTPKIGLQSNTVSGIIKRNITEKIPGIGTRWKPYVLRATSASYKLAYGVSIPDVLRIGDWKSTGSLYKHYYFKPITSLNPARLYDCQPHDWILPRTYVLLQQPNLPELRQQQPAPTPSPDTQNDFILAQTLSGHNTRSTRSRR